MCLLCIELLFLYASKQNMLQILLAMHTFIPQEVYVHPKTHFFKNKNMWSKMIPVLKFFNTDPFYKINNLWCFIKDKK